MVVTVDNAISQVVEDDLGAEEKLAVLRYLSEVVDSMALDIGGMVILTLADALQRSHHSTVEASGTCEED